MKVSEVTCELSGQDFALQPSLHSKAVLWERVLVRYFPGVCGVRSTRCEQCCAQGCRAVNQTPNPLRALGTHIWFLAQVRALSTCLIPSRGWGLSLYAGKLLYSPHARSQLVGVGCGSVCATRPPLDWGGGGGRFDCVFLQKAIFSFWAFQWWLGGIMRYSCGVFPKHSTSSQSLGDGLEELKSVLPCCKIPCVWQGTTLKHSHSESQETRNWINSSISIICTAFERSRADCLMDIWERQSAVSTSQNVAQALTLVNTSRSLWIIWVFFFLIFRINLVLC